jgi:hypothetical protein
MLAHYIIACSVQSVHAEAKNKPNGKQLTTGKRGLQMYRYRIVQRASYPQAYICEYKISGWRGLFDNWSFFDSTESWVKAQDMCITAMERDKNKRKPPKILQVYNP